MRAAATRREREAPEGREASYNPRPHPPSRRAPGGGEARRQREVYARHERRHHAGVRSPLLFLPRA
eukprot:3413686-Prymnesium_polylepis.1